MLDDSRVNMIDIYICKIGQMGCIMFNCFKVLNVLFYEMCFVIEDVLDVWVMDDSIKMLVIDVEGDCVFCVGGDIQEMYDMVKVGNYDYGCIFWCDEYCMNVKMFEFFKFVVIFL